MLQNTTYKPCKTHIGYGTEDRIEYNMMKDDAQYKHIVFTDRENVRNINDCIHAWTTNVTTIIVLYLPITPI